MTGGLVGCCGLDCSDCDMREAAGDPDKQRQFARWFKEHMGLDVAPETIGCTWCRGEREGHWSADCWILKCCADGRGLGHCSDCPDFACARLVDWAGQNDRYREALERLRRLRAG